MINLKKFKKAAKVFAKKSTKSKKVAKQTLIDLGIYNDNGTLSKNYK